jgi:CarD family transcriptional regulator
MDNLVLNRIKANDYVVYPAHGVGRLVAREVSNVAGHSLDLFVIEFEKERMTLRLPVHKAVAAGLRPLSTKAQMDVALEGLSQKSRAKRAMWSRRAQEYETKINSGDPASIAQVVRELFRKQADAEQSYSERQIYQAAVERLARELALVNDIREEDAVEHVETLLRDAA